MEVLGAGLDRISREKQQPILTTFPRLAFKDGFKGCLCNVVRQKPMTAVDNILRDFGIRYVDGFTPPDFADLVAGAEAPRQVFAIMRSCVGLIDRSTSSRRYPA